MKTRLIVALLAVAGAAAAVSAQNTATYQIVFTSNAPGTIGSGTNAITVPRGAPVNTVVSVLTNPGVGGTMLGLPVHGIADGSFSLSGAGVAGLGSWGNHTVPYPYNFLYGFATTAGNIAGYNVNGAIWGTGSPWTVPVPTPPGPITNPDNVWEGQFVASLTSLGAVHFTLTQMGPTFVWVGNVQPASLAFQTHPGPGGSITVTGCYPDCDAGGTLSVADFTCFQSAFVAGSAYADCDGNTLFTVADFACFQTAFLAGCP